MHKNKIDDIFNKGLSNQNFEISDAFLNDLDTRLNQKKKKGLLFWFGTTGVLTLILVITVFSVLKIDSKQIVDSKNNSLDLDIQSNQKTNNLIELNENNNSSIHNSLKNRNKEASFTQNSQNTLRKEINKTKVKSQNNDFKKASKVISTQSDKVSSSNPNINKEQNSNLISKISTNSHQLDNSKKDKLTQSKTENKDELTQIKPIDNFTQTAVKDTVFKSNNEVPSSNNILADGLNNNNVKDSVNNSDKIQTENTSHTDSTINDVSSNNSSTSSTQSKKMNLLLTLGFGNNFMTSKYSGIDGDYYQSNTIESNTLGYNFNMNVLLKDQFIIGSGIGMNQQKYTYDFNTSLTTYDTTITTESIYVLDNYIYQQGNIVDSVYHYNTTTTTVIDSTVSLTNYSNTTKTDYISIPLNIGYNYTYKKLMFGVVLSAKYNYLQNVKGGYYSNNTFTTFNENDNVLFKKSYFSYEIKGSLAYNIFDNFYLHSSFSFSPYSKTVFKTPNLERKIKYSNLSVGLTYKL